MRHRGIAGVFGVAVAVAITVAVVACRQLVGIGDAPPQGQPAEAGPEVEAGVCGLPITGGSCATCIGASCCAYASSCAASPSCAHYATCLGNCNADVACRTSCSLEYAASGAGSETAALLACMASSCQTECVGGACGGLDIGSTPDAAVGCASCVSMTASGCESEQKCASSAACVGVGLCAQACQGGVVCADTCLSPVDAGSVLDFNSWQEQSNGTCRPQCVGTGDWSCLGSLASPPPQAPATSLTLAFYDEFNSPTPGIAVQVCAQGAETCDPPSGTSDVHGNATVTVPLPSTSVQGGAALFGPTGFVRLSSAVDAGLAAELLYWGDPLSQAAGRVSVPILSPAEEDAVANGVHVALNPQLGHVLAVSFDCRAVAASGVRMVLETPGDSASTGAFYESQGSFSTANTATDVTGAALFLNIAPGTVQVVATPGILAPTVGSRASVVVQANTLTIVYMPPTG